ncbi:MAG: SAM-dependent methyltransferase [Anaerolineales bacterium]|uniref:SAM-dependent methyltransferase n=1 Tax=Candidatus Villigracilis vicinus TaxID=3140679 RepID=UPI003135C084|nr:SAM-dependent methyltransferase [Anaerolineales bacterium]
MKPIGVIHTPFKEKSETPIQFSRSTAFGEIEIYSEFEEGLTSIEGLSHLILVYVFHEALESKSLLVKPFLDENSTDFRNRTTPAESHWLFSCAACQANGSRLKIQWVDMLDGTPLLDIKPYVPEFDVHKVDKLGWYETRSHQ